MRRSEFYVVAVASAFATTLALAVQHPAGDVIGEATEGFRGKVSERTQALKDQAVWPAFDPECSAEFNADPIAFLDEHTPDDIARACNLPTSAEYDALVQGNPALRSRVAYNVISPARNGRAFGLPQERVEAYLASVGPKVRITVDKSTQWMTVVSPAGTKRYPVSTGDPRIGQETAVGCFVPDAPLKTRYYTAQHGASKGAPMPYAIHFDGGNAIHSTEPRFYHLLGKRRASHGCVRTYLEHAKEINELVWMHGRRFPTLSEMEPGATAVTAAPPRARRQSFDYSNTLICVR